MKAASERISIGALLPAWKGLRKSVPHFGPIRNDRHYRDMNILMEYLLAEVGEDEDHQFADLLDIVSTLVEEYEDRNSPLEDVSPRDALKFLMEQHGLKQSDLKKDIGSQGVVSEILAGDREINVRQARALAKRFGVSPAVFV